MYSNFWPRVYFLAAIAFLSLLTGCPDPPTTPKESLLLAKQWQTPSSTSTTQDLFPPTALEFQLVETAQSNELTTLSFPCNTHSATYKHADQLIQVHLCRDMSQSEIKSLAETARSQVTVPGKHKSIFSAYDKAWELKRSDGSHLRFYIKNNWVAIIESPIQKEDIEFDTAFLTAK